MKLTLSNVLIQVATRLHNQSDLFYAATLAFSFRSLRHSSW